MTDTIAKTCQLTKPARDIRLGTERSGEACPHRIAGDDLFKLSQICVLKLPEDSLNVIAIDCGITSHLPFQPFPDLDRHVLR